MKRARAGFTFVEVLTSMTVIAILAGIVIPKVGDFVTRAKATAAVADINNVATAVGLYANAAATDSTVLPPTAAMGQVPDSLKPDLGENFSFVKSDYSLQYNNWTIPGGVGGSASAQTIIGITLQTSDARLGQLVLELAQWPHFQSGQTYTFIVFGSF